MADGTQIYTLKMILLELAGLILADLLRLHCYLGLDAVNRLLGKNTPAAPGRVELSLNLLPHELKLEDIDVDQFPIGHVVKAMHYYVNEQHYPVGMQMFVFEAEMEKVEDLVLTLQSDLFETFRRDQVHMGRASDADWKALPDLYAKARARLRLDMGESLYLGDIAVLAGITEKSVRNALAAAGDAQLRSQEATGGPFDSISIDNDEARRWLALRRGFVPTRFGEMSAEPGQHPISLNSFFEIGAYLHQRWTSLGKTPACVHRELEWPDAKFDYLNSITGSPQKIDPRDCGDLARSLLVSESWFTAQVMRNLFPHQVALLLGREEQVEPPPPQTQLTPDNDRICSRVRFILRDGTSLFPIQMKNRDSGKVAFRLSKGGAGGNTKENTIEVESEDEMIDRVCRKGLAVRLMSADGSRQGLYRADGRSVRCVELDGVEI